MTVRIGIEVAAALDAGTPVVALESTVYSTLGLPAPANRVALERSLAAVSGVGAVPAVTAVLDGVPTVGLEPAEHERILVATTKVAERDLSVAMARQLDVGVTTVSASLALASAAGIGSFATGGIGGVHRGVEHSGDVSADLDAIAAFPVATVCAGAKAFLDLARTLEYLESSGVPVLGYRTDHFPAFYVRDSGLPAPHRVESPAEIAAILHARVALGSRTVGVLVANPIPAEAELDPERLDDEINAALSAADAAGLSGPAVTPFVLAMLADETDGRSIPANLALVENNCRLAAHIAQELLA